MTHPTVDFVIKHIRHTYGRSPEYPWAKSPEQPGSAVFRHAQNQKWFALIIPRLPRHLLHLAGEGSVDVLNVKCDPMLIGSLMGRDGFLPAYHMNKEHWITLLLDGTVAEDELCQLIGLSFSLTAPHR